MITAMAHCPIDRARAHMVLFVPPFAQVMNSTGDTSSPRGVLGEQTAGKSEGSISNLHTPRAEIAEREVVE